MLKVPSSNVDCQQGYEAVVTDFNCPFEPILHLAIELCGSYFAEIHISDTGKRWSKSLDDSTVECCDESTKVFESIIPKGKPFEIFDINENEYVGLHYCLVNKSRMRHYVSTPIKTLTGNVIGTLSVLGNKPKRLSDYQKAMLSLLARDINSQIEHTAKEYKKYEIDCIRKNLSKEFDDFTHLAAHDLTSPLNAIKNVSTWIEEDLEEGRKKDNTKHFAMLKNSVSRINRLLTDISCYSKVCGHIVEPENIDLALIVDDICESLGFTERFNIQVNSCELRLPKQAFHFVLEQLITNAVKHHDKEHGTITVQCSSEAAHYCLSVQDDGPGMAIQFHDKIFLPFHSLKSKDEIESSGLGLAMVKKTLAPYLGNVSVKSDVGHGSTFMVIWPKK